MTSKGPKRGMILPPCVIYSLSTTVVFAFSVDSFLCYWPDLQTANFTQKTVKTLIILGGGFFTDIPNNFINFGFTVVLQTSSHWHSNRWKSPPLRNIWFYNTILYSFNADKTDTWNNEQVLRFSASSSVWCGDWCGSTLTTLTFTCCVF